MVGEMMAYVLAVLVAACLGLTAWCLILALGHKGAISRLSAALGGVESQSGFGTRMDVLERRSHDDAESIRKQLVELDRNLRETVANSTRDGFAAAFDKVQSGAKAQAEELSRFGKELRDTVGEVRQGVSSLTERVTAALAAAEMAAAEGRARLLENVSGAVQNAQDGIKATLNGFGEQHGQRLDGVTSATREANETVQARFGEFRTEMSDRLDAIRRAAADVLERASTTFGEIKQAVTASEAKTERTLADQREAVLERLGAGQIQVGERLSTSLSDLMGQVKTGFDAFAAQLRDEQEQLRGRVDTKLEEMRAGNEAKLEQMREAVDQRLQTALEKSVGESFQRVADQFAQVQQAIGQVQSVAGQVGDLKRLFSNVKSRGGWGEAQIEALLDDVLPAGCYERNVRVRGEGSTEVVEFALRVPLKGRDKDVWLPIDAKFPTADYDRLLLAGEAGNRDEEQAARRALESCIRTEAQRISTKYICVPATVEFAVMYLPTEGLFSEVARTPGLVESIRRQHRVMVMGPGLLPALLHCIRVGHLTMVLEQKASAIGETLGAVKTEWDKLGKVLDTLADRAEKLSKGIEDTRTPGHARAPSAASCGRWTRSATSAPRSCSVWMRPAWRRPLRRKWNSPSDEDRLRARALGHPNAVRCAAVGCRPRRRAG